MTTVPMRLLVRGLTTQPQDPGIPDEEWPHPVPPPGPQVAMTGRPDDDDMPTPYPPPTPRAALRIGRPPQLPRLDRAQRALGRLMARSARYAAVAVYAGSVVVLTAAWVQAGAAAAFLLIALIAMFALTRSNASRGTAAHQPHGPGEAGSSAAAWRAPGWVLRLWPAADSARELTLPARSYAAPSRLPRQTVRPFAQAIAEFAPPPRPGRLLSPSPPVAAWPAAAPATG